jgi:hypothetical protein
MQGETHRCTPLRRNNRRSGEQRRHRLSSSAPSVSTTTVEPLPAASIITPMMLLALMRRVPLAHPDFALELAGELRQLGRGSGMQAQFVDDFGFFGQHFNGPAC